MVNTFYKSFRADDRSYFSLIKKDVHAAVSSAGFDEVKVGKVDIIVSEITSNLSKHAKGGELLVGIGNDPGGVYIEIISLDQGPGIPDIGRVMSDGYSSTTTLGHGLGSIKRLSDLFDVYSVRDWGTILVVRMYKEDQPAFKKRRLECRGINVPKNGELVSGDGFCLEEMEAGFRLLIADGLGHGPDANEAVRQACEAFRACTEESPTDTIRYIHNQIRKTRGVVGLVVVYNNQTRTWKTTGVGNIAARWMGASNTRNHVSYNGIIGYNIPGSMNEQLMSQEEYPQFIACSDGIKSRWDIAKFPMLMQHDGMIIASALYKEFSRGTDDTSVLVCKSV
ncbi:MAG TPA: ATP-binding SpoIIE family protein phosphatase [Puia sp.]|jgi:anti-sigma regulatory factor (Ser/Thr protein kinase)|nr:ATP-binding SpoIIE family protein phosphatase [Puia sp.]